MIYGITLYGFINDEMNNKLLMGLGGFGHRVEGILISCVILYLGDFSCFRPNGDSWGFLSN